MLISVLLIKMLISLSIFLIPIFPIIITIVFFVLIKLIIFIHPTSNYLDWRYLNT